MNILIAVHHLPPRYIQGAELRALRTARALTQNGHSVKIVCIERIESGQAVGVTHIDEIFEGIPVRRLFYNIRLAPNRVRFEYDNPWLGDAVRRMFYEDKPDLFHQFSGYLWSGRPLRVAQEMGIPTVLSLTDFWFLCKRIQMFRSDNTLSTLPIDPVRCAKCVGEEQRRYRYPAQLFPRIMNAFWEKQSLRIGQARDRMNFLLETLNRVDAIVSPSRFLRNMFIEAGIDSKRIVYSRQGRDFSDLTESAFVKTPSSQLRLGYLGQIIPIKGVSVLAQAVRLLPVSNFTLDIYGKLDQNTDYVREIARLVENDSRVVFGGPYGPKDLTKVMQSLDAVVVPSVWYENSPNVILEAFAHRTPVIASDLGGMAELVEHNTNGLRFKVGDAADLAWQIRRLIEEPGLLAQLREGISAVRTVSEEIDELMSFYETVSRQHTPKINYPIDFKP
jgi:glycosyltransferase involved in cell wall biosynthesis